MTATILTTDEMQLVDAAKSIRTKAHAPYSGYFVGAAILDANGNRHTGCNVENASYSQAMCAEANAIGAMIAAGGKRIVTIAVVGGADDLEACTPCGGCRQRIFEFADEKTEVILYGKGVSIERHSMDALLPGGFRLL